MGPGVACDHSKGALLEFMKPSSGHPSKTTHCDAGCNSFLNSGQQSLRVHRTRFKILMACEVWSNREGGQVIIVAGLPQEEHPFSEAIQGCEWSAGSELKPHRVTSRELV